MLFYKLTKNFRSVNLYYSISTLLERVLTEVIGMLTERQLAIFKAIIDDFIAYAHPVGSRAISEKKHMNISAATIRNVMAELEEMGYLEKTHTSSGRIPSEKGYRFYVDRILSSDLENRSNLKVIQHILEDGLYELEQIVQTSANILSDLTNYTTIILGPEIFHTKLEQFQIVMISKHTAVAIMITDAGHVEHRSFKLPTKIDGIELEKLVNILNERLRGVPIANLPQMLNSELTTFMTKYIKNARQILGYLKDIFFQDEEHPVKLYIGGKSNLLMQPEFKDIDKVHSFFSMIENEDEVARILKEQTNGLKVTIGNENEIDALKDFSIISTSYQMNDEQGGTIALLGPTRMQYKRVIQILHAFSKEMSEVLCLWYDSND